MNDGRLWKWFSMFIRLRDSDENGICSCFTCGRVGHWKTMDCGHGIGRQHKATKFNEMNNHAQCKRCNGFEEGRKDVYSKRVDEIHGRGAWNTLLVLSRMTTKRTQAEIDWMTNYYRDKVKAMLKLKGEK